MRVQIVTLIPAIATMAWAIGVKLRQRQHAEALFLSMGALCAIVNAMLVYKMTVSDISVGQHIVQMAACSCIIPLVYMFFSTQTGRSFKNPTIITLWVLAAFSFIPNIIISNPFLPIEYPDTPMKPFALYVVEHGRKVFAIYMGDLMVAFQAIVTMVHLIFLVVKMRRSGLKFNPKVYVFGIWWILAILAVLKISGMTNEEFHTARGEWFYFTTYSIMIMALNAFIVMGFDLHPVQTEQGEAVEDIQVYLNQQYGAMAAEMRKIVEDDKLYLHTGCTAELMVELLHTNRTYFSQMISEELNGITFSEYINGLRLTHAEELLRESKLPMSEIAYQCGYSDPGYMSRKFKEKHAMSPSEWRKHSA